MKVPYLHHIFIGRQQKTTQFSSSSSSYFFFNKERVFKEANISAI